MIHLLDTNVLIAAKKNSYPFDVCPGFWDGIIQAYRNNKVISIDRVKDEILHVEDELAKWIKDNMPSSFFRNTGANNLQQKYKKILNWVNSTNSREQTKQNFAKGADGWLVAFSMENDSVVVTEEQTQPGSKRKIKIPDVCTKFNVNYMDTISMLRELGMKFILES